MSRRDNYFREYRADRLKVIQLGFTPEAYQAVKAAAGDTPLATWCKEAIRERMEREHRQ